MTQQESENAKFQIPIYKLEQISTVLAELNIKVSINDLKKPSPEFASNIHKEFLTQFMSLRSDLIEQELKDLALHFPEDIIKTQGDSFKVLQFYLIVQYWYHACGLETSFLKIFHPTKQELLKNISAMIAFCKFEFSELSNFQQVVDKTKDYIVKCEEIKKESEELSSNLFSINSELNSLKPLVEKSKTRSESLKEKLARFQESRKKLKEERDVLLKEDQSLDAEHKEIMSKQEIIVKKFNLYEKLIIKSPTRLNSEMEKNEARIAELEKLIIQINKENDEEKRKMFEKEKFIESSDKIFEILINLYENHVHTANIKSQEIESIKEEITNLNFKLEQGISSNMSVTAELERVKTSRSKLSDEFQVDMMKYKQQQEKYKEEKKILCKELEELNLRREELIRERNESNKLTQEKMDKGIEMLNYLEKIEDVEEKNREIKFKMITNLKKDTDSKHEHLALKFKQMTETFTKLMCEYKN